LTIFFGILGLIALSQIYAAIIEQTYPIYT